jgi:uncharacterized membrane protein YhaH (DUF805 family)
MTWKWLKWFLFSFKGRVNRAPFLMFHLLLTTYYFILEILFKGIEIQIKEITLLAMLSIFIWPSLAKQAKRWHDINKSTWYLLINLIPLGSMVALFVNAVIASDIGPNRFGNDPLEGKPRIFTNRNLTPKEIKILITIGIILMFFLFGYSFYILFTQNN